MSAGWYKRRRGILEHIESGTIDLLESGIHDYLSLKANLLIGSPCSIPVGICFTSAPAIHVHCPRVSERTVQRCLEHMEQIGWLKTWKVPGRRGNYPVLVCRGSVHDVSGNEYRINGEKTKDWHYPVYEPVGEVSASASTGVVTPSGNREVRSEKEKREKPTATPRFSLPDWIPLEPWNDFLEMRKSLRSSPTERAKALLVRKLQKLKSEGQDPNAVLEQSIERSWKGVFPVREQTPGRKDASVIETKNRIAAGFPVD